MRLVETVGDKWFKESDVSSIKVGDVLKVCLASEPQGTTNDLYFWLYIIAVNCVSTRW